MNRVGKTTVQFVSLMLLLSLISAAETRTLESPFALSADLHSEFSTQFQLFSAGRIVIEAGWKGTSDTTTPRPLRIVLFRPDGSEAISREGISPLRFACEVSEAELHQTSSGNPARWKVRISNDAAGQRQEATGRLRIGIPITSRTLAETQFTLLGTGNAQEIPVSLPAPGRVVIEAEWQTDQRSRDGLPAPLTLSLIHPGQDRILGRRTGRSSLRIEQQITVNGLERGRLLLIRLQNDNTMKVMGRVKAVFTPDL